MIPALVFICAEHLFGVDVSGRPNAGPERPGLQVAAQAPSEKVAEIRVHGNATIPDAIVIQLAGISVGSTLGPSDLAAVEKRLRDSGRFDAVQVRKRYRTLAMDDVALVLLVHERPGVSPSGQPPSVLRQLRSRLMFFPIIYYDDGYGWTYGARTTVVDLMGKGTHLMVPLSWGANKRAAIEADRTFKSGPLTRITGTVGIAQHVNPFFVVEDRRTQLKGRAERRLFDMLTFGGELARTQVVFGQVRDQLWTTTADATLDTRRDPTYPSNAVLAGVVWTRLNSIGASSFTAAGGSVDRYTFDARGYKRLFHQNVLAVRAQYDTASAPLPQYEQPLLEGSTLRGTRAGSFAGDKRLIWSTELRVPVSSPLETGRLGLDAFLDSGATARYGERIADQKEHRGVGAGVWLIFTVIQLNFDVAHPLDGRGVRFHFGTGFTF
jgi:outer membrane protein assembly factor BamA